MPRKKSADTIREQTNRICRMAVERLKEGTLRGEAFSQRIAAVTNIERMYTDNIHKNPVYIVEISKHSKSAEKIPFLRSEYMNYEGIPCKR